MHKFLLTGLATTLLSASASAQAQFITQAGGSFGTRLNATTTSVQPVTLGFNFPFPGGNVVTEVDVHATGRILEVGADANDGSETVAELLAEAPSIMVRWDVGNTFPDPASDIYFATDGATVATITWAEVTFGAGGPATIQAQLFSDGHVTMVFDSRVGADDGIAGISVGNGAPDPGGTDLSGIDPANPLVTTDDVIYEDFDFGGFDLAGSSLEFFPTLPGYFVIRSDAVMDVAGGFAQVESNGGGCQVFESFTTTFFPNGAGGYDVVSGPSLFDPNIGPSQGQTADDTINITGLDLGFPFPFPGGTTEQLVRIDPNGRILPDSSGETFGDWNPTVAELEGDGFAQICCWLDFNVAEAGSGNIHFQSTSGVATITWNGVSQFTTGDPVFLTSQIQLFADGSIFITVEDFTELNQAGTANRDVIIGVSDGMTTGSGEIDITSTTLQSAPVVAYEYWDASGATPLEPVDFLPLELPPVLASLSIPSLGSNWDLQIQRMPAAATSGFILIGFFTTNTPLDVIGLPCTLNVIEATGSVPVLPNGSGDSNVFSIPISTDPVVIGLPLAVQGATTGAPFTPFPLYFTNSFVGTVGN